MNSVPSDPSECVFIVIDDDHVIPAWRVKRMLQFRSFLRSKLPDQASCLISDVRMPGLSGFDLHARLVKQRINIPVIFVSGYADIPMSVKAHRHHTASAHMMDFLTLIYTFRLQGHRPRTEKGGRRRIGSPPG